MENIKRNIKKELLALNANGFKSISTNFMCEHKEFMLKNIRRYVRL